MTLALILFLLPETHKQSLILETAEESSLPPSRPSSGTPSLSHASTRSVVSVRAKKYTLVANQIFVEPLKIILYLRFPAVALVVYYAAIAFGSLYFLNISVQKTFSAPPYNFSVIIVGCLYIFNSLGYILASIFGGRWVDYVRYWPLPFVLRPHSHYDNKTMKNNTRD